VRVDFHVHQPSAGAYPAEAYLALMDAHGIDVSVVFTYEGLISEPERNNDSLAAWCEGHRDRLVPFCTVNPRSRAAADEVRRCADKYDVRGVKLHPWLQAFSPLDPALDPVCRTASELGLPMLFHDGTPPFSTPLQVAHVAARHPGLTVVLGHGGLHDMTDDAIAAARRHPNVVICMCSLAAGFMEQIVAAAPLDQLVFGTDGGLFATAEQPYVGYRFRELECLELAPAKLERILSRNPARLLGLEVPEPAR
jgi:predicted TIM-barrel fold metal-dependent hydrolase